MSKITINVPEITIGMDLGNKKHDICVLNSAGEKIDQTKIENNIVCLEEYFENIKLTQRCASQWKLVPVHYGFLRSLRIWALMSL